MAKALVRPTSPPPNPAEGEEKDPLALFSKYAERSADIAFRALNSPAAHRTDEEVNCILRWMTDVSHGVFCPLQPWSRCQRGSCTLADPGDASLSLYAVV